MVKKVICKENNGIEEYLTIGKIYDIISVISLDNYNLGYYIINDKGVNDIWYHESWFETIEEYDMINPNHYKQGDKETWEQMLEIWGKDAFIKHCEITAFKYIQRLGKKPNNSIEQDLEKARWYLNKAYDLKNN